MVKNEIDRVAYKNAKKEMDFEIVDLQLFFSTRAKSFIEKDCRINFWTILFIIEGQGQHYIDFKKVEYHDNSVVFIQKNQVHRYVVNYQVKGYAIHINEPFFYLLNGFRSELFLDLIDQALGVPILFLEEGDVYTSKMLVDLLYREYSKRESMLNSELIATLFQGFVLSLKGIASIENNLLLSKDYEYYKAFRQLLEENYCKIRTVERYAELMKTSKKTINNATRKVSGLSAKEFIIERVVLEIKRYLSQGDLLNYEISEILGFDDAANMTRFFKKYTGLSPKKFRDELEKIK